eukprot:contig_3878_g850
MKATDAVPRLQAALQQHPSLDAAVQAVALDAGVSAAALRRAFYRHRTGAGHRHGNALLTSEQDEVLLGVVQAVSGNNFTLSSAQIADVVKRRWSTDAVFNYDETRVVMRGGRMTTRRVEARDKDRPNITTTRDNTVTPLLTFVAASGTVFFSVYVLKGRFGEEDSADVKFSLEEAPQASRRSWRRFYCSTETGYLNGVTFRKVIEDFTCKWGVRNPGREALLFGDQLGRHKEV